MNCKESQERRTLRLLGVFFASPGKIIQHGTRKRQEPLVAYPRYRRNATLEGLPSIDKARPLQDAGLGPSEPSGTTS